MPPPKTAAPVKRCAVDGCKVRLTGTSANIKCRICALEVCLDHQFPTDHVCKKPQDAAAASAGLLVVGNKKAPAAAATAAPVTGFPELKVHKSSAAAPAVVAVAAPVAIVEEPPAPAVLSLKDESPDALAQEFLQAVGKNKIQRTKLFGALQSLSENVSMLSGEILDVAHQAFGRIASSNQKSEVIALLETAVFASTPVAGLLLSYVMMVSRITSNDDALFELGDRIINVCLTKLAKSFEGNVEQVGTWIALVFTELLFMRNQDIGASPLVESTKLNATLARLAIKITTKPTIAVFILAGLLHSMSTPATAALEESKLFMGKEINLSLLHACALVLGREFEPFCYHFSQTGEMLLTKYGKGDADSRLLAIQSARAICRNVLGPSSIQVWTQNLLLSTTEQAPWRSKEFSFDLMQVIIDFKADYLAVGQLPSIVLSLAAGVVEIKKEVSLKASLALDAVGNSVTNPETKKLMPFLLDAIKKPDEGTDRCLSELMDATFVNSLNSTSVSLIVPVVTRALREGSADLKRRGAIATGNVCNLVRDIDDVRQFEAAISQELIKLREHSSPEVRKAAEKAWDALGVALAKEQMVVTKKPMSPRLRQGKVSVANSVVEELKDAGVLNSPTEIDFTTTALDALVKVLMVAPAGDLSLQRVQQEIRRELGFLPKSSAEQCAKLLFNALRIARSLSFEVADAEEEARRLRGDTILVDIQDMILAYASRVLLSRTRLTLKRGHRYGLVGKIGVGKTTLASRLAKGDLESFPVDVSTYMVLHEVMKEDMGKTVHEYMGGDEVAKDTLFSVGFKDPSVLISTLSGGWRMRLAIAKSMLANADLIVLDEPTNHVDVSGVAWLADYLKSLEHKGVTCVIVSHDYDFLSNGVTTDVLHITNQRLESFEGGFEDFQLKYPEVAAALPKMKKKDAVVETTPEPSRTATPAGGEAIGEEGIPPQSEEHEADVGSAMFDMMSSSDATHESVSAMFNSKNIPSISFPDPGKLEGISSKGKPVMTATHLTFAYPSNLGRVILNDVSCKLSLNSRVAIRGANGQGKSTLLKLMVGELAMNEESKGTLFKHHNLRIAYVSQHAVHHLGVDLDITPVQYLQRRYFEGRDKERGQMITLALDEDDKAMMKVRGEVKAVISRVLRGKALYYEIEIAGSRRGGDEDGGRMSRNTANATSNTKDFRSLAQLEAMNRPHVIKLVKMFDEEMKYEASGLALRPVTQVEILKGLAEFGIDADFAERKIRWLSGGQKARLVMAASMWHKPHLMVLDEPTNFLDAETLAVLTHSLRTFKGAVLAVSHHEAFIRVLCNEAWDINNGKLTVVTLKEKFKIGAAATTKDDEE
ncbi:hypothetical protein BASA81_008425 [Batrachochytrium salamandrivorans]|nr:hypothetical protein BASA81_008425 [Batrachochytrium salamandrivorans]